MLTEWSATCQSGTLDQTTICEGIGGVVVGANQAANTGLINTRQQMIQGIDTIPTTGFGVVPIADNPSAIAGALQSSTRRYAVGLTLGLFNQSKLIPTKWMASQLAIEITLAPAAECIFVTGTAAGTGQTPTYNVSNVNLIPEILEFDQSYDAMFFMGLRKGGVPLKFSSWHTYISTAGSSNVNSLIQERSRSVKALFTVQRRSPGTLFADSGAMVMSSAASNNLIQYQYRIGGR